MAPTPAVLGAALFAYMTAWFVLAAARRDNSLADVAWGGGFVLLAFLSLAMGRGWQPRPILVSSLVTVWGLRLALHVAARNRGRGEDFRYAAWRRQWGSSWWWRSYLQVFLLQGLILAVVASPVVLINLRSTGPLGASDLAGALAWLAGFLCEAIADRQLLRFTRDPSNRGRILNRGLWRFSRHPNYFGEVLQWWGIWLLALAVPGGWATVIGPALITFLLLKVSGVPMLEKAFAGRPGFADYKRRTSVFIPWFPRRSRPPGRAPQR
jgi:steroid 5-alpha reductase family enzyme